ncbi:hypothetical protein Tco_1021820 [Tanacetum coccineum]
MIWMVVAEVLPDAFKVLSIHQLYKLGTFYSHDSDDTDSVFPEVIGMLFLRLINGILSVFGKSDPPELQKKR